MFALELIFALPSTLHSLLNCKAARRWDVSRSHRGLWKLRSCCPHPLPENQFLERSQVHLSIQELSEEDSLNIPALSGPVLRDTARLSQRYPPIARYGVFDVSTWPIGCDTPSPLFWAFPHWRACEVEVRYPPSKGVSQRYLRDTLRKQGKRVRYPTLRYYLEKVLRDTGGVSRTGPLSPCMVGRLLRVRREFAQGEEKQHININKFAGLSRDWAGGKILFMFFFHVIPYWGEKTHKSKVSILGAL